MGGAWFSTNANPDWQPFAWRAQFPRNIVDKLVSFDNPTGTINNSELELAGAIVHQDVLLQQVNVAHRTIVPLGDNTAAVSWQTKGSTSTSGPSAYLLGMNSLHQRHHRYLAKPDYISGPANTIADVCSRRFDLSDSQLLSYLDVNFPQSQPWQLSHPRSEMISSISSALLKRRPAPASYLNDKKSRIIIGKFGRNTAGNTTSTQRYKPTQTGLLYSQFSPTDSAMAITASPAKTFSELERWRTTYAPSVRRSPAWGPIPTHGSILTVN
jgi:hypothetical protein